MALVHRILEFLTSIELLMAMLWLGLAIFTIGLVVLMYTRWGQYKPLRKCVAMSLLAHLLLAGYATTVEIIAPAMTREHVFDISLGDGPDPAAKPGGAGPAAAQAAEQPWEAFPGDAIVAADEPTLQRIPTDMPEESPRTIRADDVRLPGEPLLEHVGLTEAEPPAPNGPTVAKASGRYSSDESAASIEVPPAQRRDAVDVVPDVESPDRIVDELSASPMRMASGDVPAMLLQEIVPLSQATQSDSAWPRLAPPGPAAPSQLQPVGRFDAGSVFDAADDSAHAASGRGANANGVQGGPEGNLLVARNVSRPDVPRTSHGPASSAQSTVPDAYRLRVAPNRDGIAQSHGGTSETEAAVKAALKWLADNQAADGRWDPRVHDAGKDANVLGRSRPNAGSRADTAITGLALLSFLGSGHTHRDGPYRDNVRRGLEFLIQSQGPDGNLAGQAAAYEFMYSHAMAACALSEAYGMTHDQRLREAVRRAVGYTIAAQDPNGGGWRYRPGDAGDTSQLGWQLMSLKSAELAGIPMPEQTRQGAIRFLRSVSSGENGGRASYRPGEQPTRSMTAEALVCWQFLGIARNHPACNEAGDFVLGETPGEGTYNLYYWYYATLSMYQLQGPHWQRWNESLRTALVDRQVKEGSQAGSWGTDDLWGGHGGRVFTTAMATLTLEVYYRFLPLYSGGFSGEGLAK